MHKSPALLPFLLALVACGDKSEDSDESEKNFDRDGDGYDSVALGGSDCDDTDPDVNISSVELCNGVDDDCDGEIDEDANDAITVYVDADGDGFGLGSESMKSCEVEDGQASELGDCDDGEAAVNPGAAEACDGVDTDCDGTIGEDEVDDDGDGFPGCELADHGWLGSEAYVDSDCDDTDADVYPGAEEVCDGADTDCDGVLPEDESDLDGDGYALCESDCDDDDTDVNPGAVEDCTDEADQDCDDLIDCEDPDCEELPPCAEECDNGVDDDGDGLVDCEDGGCVDFADCIEVCDDDVDNDADGLTDCEDIDDCVGTTACPVTRQVSLTSGTGHMYAVQYSGYDFSGISLWSLSGTVATYDSSGGSWNSCVWVVGDVEARNNTGAAFSGMASMSLSRRNTSVRGSCSATQVGSFLPTTLRLDGGATPKAARLTYTTALGASSVPWYLNSGRTTSVSRAGVNYWGASGDLASQSFWMND